MHHLTVFIIHIAYRVCDWFYLFFYHLWFGYAIIFIVFTNIYRLKDTFC